MSFDRVYARETTPGATALDLRTSCVFVRGRRRRNVKVLFGLADSALLLDKFLDIRFRSNDNVEISNVPAFASPHAGDIRQLNPRVSDEVFDRADAAPGPPDLVVEELRSCLQCAPRKIVADNEGVNVEIGGIKRQALAAGSDLVRRFPAGRQAASNLQLSRRMEGLQARNERLQRANDFGLLFPENSRCLFLDTSLDTLR